VNLPGAECLVQKGLEEVVGLAGRFDMCSAEFLVPRDQVGELLLERQRRIREAQSGRILFSNVLH
jgi:hypothetical protein